MKSNSISNFLSVSLKEKEKRIFSFKLRNLLLLAAFAGSGTLVNAQTFYEPTSLTGFTQDIIANGIGDAINSTTAAADGAAIGYALVAQDFQIFGTDPLPTESLPNGGSIVAGSKVYQLADYATNNSLRLDVNSQSGTLTFVTPKQASMVHVLGLSGSAESYVNAVVWFTDNTSETFNALHYPDWFDDSSLDTVISHVGRVNLANNYLEYGIGPLLSETTLNISLSNQTKLIEKIEFTNQMIFGSVMNVLAISTSYFPPCAGTPDAGTITGASSICANIDFTLTVPRILATEISYQWQESVSGANSWTDIPGANDFTADISSGITTATDYRLIATCTNGGASDTTSVFTVSIKGLLECFCTPEYINDCGDGDNIKDVILVGNLAPGINNLNTACSPNGYGDYTSMSAQLSAGITYSGNVTTSYNDPDENVRIWIDYNKNSVFENTETIGTLADMDFNATGAFSFLVPANTPAGTYRMRVRLVYDEDPNTIDPCNEYGYGESEDYTIVIVAAPSCSGTPTANPITGISSICFNTDFVLTSSAIPELDISYQWQNSVSGANNWSDIIGANNNSVNISGSITTATDYRLIVTCTNGNASDTTNLFTVSLKPVNECFCSFAIDEDVEPITLVNFAGINNASSEIIDGTPALEDFTSITGAVTTEISYPIEVEGNTVGNYNSFVTVFIDWNQNGSFADANETFNLPDLINTTGTDGQKSTANIYVPWNAHAGATGMRVVKEYYYPPGGDPRTGPCGTIGYGQAEDYTLMVTTNPLAITLGNITAKNQGETNVVLWNTLREDEGDHFEVERSIDGRQFEIIGHQSGKGGPSTYTFVDHQPIPGINYYRLGLLNVDGSKAYSKIVQATMRTGNFAVEAYPNPTSNLLTIKTYGTIQANATITISDLTGRIVRTTKVTGPEINISMSDLSSGSYIIKYNDNKQNAVLKITKK